MAKGLTPSQTIGPFFSFSLTPGSKDPIAELVGNDLRSDDVVGEPILIEGSVTDGAGAPVADALIEIWQADGAGKYPDRGSNTAFRGFGRAATPGGRFAFRTVKPGATEAGAPHIGVNVFARGVLRQMVTRMYFADEPANADDPVLKLVPEERRTTLLARRDGSADGLRRYIFDIHLQGDDETVFFDV
jgi:protocatechuate 3,4-dioxygenase alpha subunit